MAGSEAYRLHPEAWPEIEAADDWYLQRSVDASAGFIAAVSDALERISQAPRRWPKYLHGTRRFVLHRFPFSIIYLDDLDRPEHRSRGPQQAKARLLEAAALDPRLPPHVLVMRLNSPCDLHHPQL